MPLIDFVEYAASHGVPTDDGIRLPTERELAA